MQFAIRNTTTSTITTTTTRTVAPWKAAVVTVMETHSVCIVSYVKITHVLIVTFSMERSTYAMCVYQTPLTYARLHTHTHTHTRAWDKEQERKKQLHQIAQTKSCRHRVKLFASLSWIVTIFYTNKIHSPGPGLLVAAWHMHAFTVVHRQTPPLPYPLETINQLLEMNIYDVLPL